MRLLVLRSLLAASALLCLQSTPVAYVTLVPTHLHMHTHMRSPMYGHRHLHPLSSSLLMRRSRSHSYSSLSPHAQTYLSSHQHSVDEVKIEHQNVPEGHKDLHSFLYDGEEDQHTPSTAPPERFAMDRDAVYPLETFLSTVGSAKVPGVFALLDQDKVVYVGVSRHTVAAVQSLQEKYGAHRFTHLQMQTFAFPRRADMEAFREHWLSEIAYVPVGIAEGWQESVREALADEQKKAYEETKLKLRKAMADTTLETPQLSDEEIYRRKRLQTAVEGHVDDWTDVINQQSAETNINVHTADEVKQSPFSSNNPVATAADEKDDESSEEMPFTLENVNKVLDEVRPYLISDGGNVGVVQVEPQTQRIVLALQGACGSCASSTVTMKMGIERVLKEAWPGVLVESTSETVQEDLSIDSVQTMLAPIKGAISGMGGEVRVISVRSGAVVLGYKGPSKIKYGIELTLKENKSINTVVFQDI